MQDEHVHVVGVKARKRGVDGGIGFVVLGRPEFGGEEYLLARHARGAYPSPDSLLVHVVVGGIDVAASLLKGALHSSLRIVRFHEEGAETFGGHLDTVVELYGFHDSASDLLVSMNNLVRHPHGRKARLVT